MTYRLLVWFGTLGLFATLAAAAPAPVGLYHFDALGNRQASDSAGASHGSASGGAAIMPGAVSGACLQLVRANDCYVSFGKGFAFPQGDFSLSVWVRTAKDYAETDSFVVARHLSGNFSGYFLFINTTATYGAPGKASFYFSNGCITSKTAVTDGAWHHLAAVYRQAANCELYVDGRLEATGDTVKMGVPDAPFLVGGIQRGSTPAGGFAGWVDELGIYDVALTAGDVAQLAKTPAPPAAGVPTVMRITLRDGKTVEIPLADIAHIEYVPVTPR